VIKGELEESGVLRLRIQLLTGKFGGIQCSVSLNVDNKAIFVEFEGQPRVIYSVPEMINDAFELLNLKPIMEKENETH